MKDEKEYVVGGKKFKSQVAANNYANKHGYNKIKVNTYGFSFSSKKK